MSRNIYKIIKIRSVFDISSSIWNDTINGANHNINIFTNNDHNVKTIEVLLPCIIKGTIESKLFFNIPLGYFYHQSYKSKYLWSLLNT